MESIDCWASAEATRRVSQISMLDIHIALNVHTLQVEWIGEALDELAILSFSMG